MKADGSGDTCLIWIHKWACFLCLYTILFRPEHNTSVVTSADYGLAASVLCVGKIWPSCLCIVMMLAMVNIISSACRVLQPAADGFDNGETPQSWIPPQQLKSYKVKWHVGNVSADSLMNQSCVTTHTKSSCTVLARQIRAAIVPIASTSNLTKTRGCIEMLYSWY